MAAGTMFGRTHVIYMPGGNASSHRMASLWTGIRSVNICGVEVDAITLEGMLRAIKIRVQQRSPSYIVTPNVDHVCLFQRDAEFRKAYRDAFLALPDGMPLMWSGRLLGTPLAQKLSGSDIIYPISELAAAEGYSVFLLGAEPGVADAAAERLRALYPGLRIAGTCSPPVGFEKSTERNAEVVERVRAAAPDICLVALGAPKQEIWMRKHCAECGTPVMIGVGGTLDFVAGRKKRAPRIFQKAGLEWLWRLCNEPRRLWKRYLVDDSLFFVLLARQLLSQARELVHHPVAPVARERRMNKKAM